MIGDDENYALDLSDAFDNEDEESDEEFAERIDNESLDIDEEIPVDDDIV